MVLAGGSLILSRKAPFRPSVVLKQLYVKVVTIPDAHADDVNAVCYGDTDSNLLYSGADDGLVKVGNVPLEQFLRELLSSRFHGEINTTAGTSTLQMVEKCVPF